MEFRLWFVDLRLQRIAELLMSVSQTSKNPLYKKKDGNKISWLKDADWW